MINDQMLLLNQPWSVSYSPDISNDVTATVQSYGAREQALSGGRQQYIFSAVREFTGEQADQKLEFFEYLLRVTLNGSTLRFIDQIVTESGLIQATVRIVGGDYGVSTDGNSHVVSCKIEVIDGLS